MTAVDPDLERSVVELATRVFEELHADTNAAAEPVDPVAALTASTAAAVRFVDAALGRFSGPLRAESGAAVTMVARAGDVAVAQVWVHATGVDPTGLTLTATPLVGDDTTTTLPASIGDVVRRPGAPAPAAALRVEVPAGTTPGTYRGVVAVAGATPSVVSVTLDVEV